MAAATEADGLRSGSAALAWRSCAAPSEARAAASGCLPTAGLELLCPAVLAGTGRGRAALQPPPLQPGHSCHGAAVLLQHLEGLAGCPQPPAQALLCPRALPQASFACISPFLSCWAGLWLGCQNEEDFKLPFSFVSFVFLLLFLIEDCSSGSLFLSPFSFPSCPT